MPAFKMKLAAAAVCVLAVLACEQSKTPVTPSGSGGGSVTLTAPTPDTPSDQQQLSTLRPTLTVRNATSTESGTRTYDFQLATRTDFNSPAISATGVGEGGGGTTSYTPTQELAGTTRFYWRARAVQGTATSDWSTTRSFNSKVVGYNRAGELYDPLTTGETIGTVVGAGTFVQGQGLRIENERSYVSYQLAQTLASGEISVEVQGLRPNGPTHKLKIFSMLDGTGDLIASRYQMAAHYRGVTGHPDNSITVKVVWGNQNIILEPDFNQRSASVVSLDPSRVYLWRGIWTSNSYRLVVTTAGTVIHDRTYTTPAGSGVYAPSPHFAYLGANSGFYNSDAGTWPGVTFKNLWVGSGPRPDSLGTVSSAR